MTISHLSWTPAVPQAAAEDAEEQEAANQSAEDKAEYKDNQNMVHCWSYYTLHVAFLLLVVYIYIFVFVYIIIFVFPGLG